MSNIYRINKEDIFEATNGGLHIILDYYPQAAPCVENHNAKFKMRDSERTASATLKKLVDNNWVVTDFGDDARPRNGIAICMKEEGLDFGGAIKFLAVKYGVGDGEAISNVFKPEITVGVARPDQQEKDWDFDVYEEIPESFLQVIFSENVFKAKEYDFRSIVDPIERTKAIFKNLRKTCTNLHYFGLKSYTIVKNRKAITIASTEYYPIFMIHEEGFEKIYQPKAEDKGRRFIYHGKFEKDFLHGQAQAITAYDDLNKDDKKKLDDVGDSEEKVELVKLKELLYLTGGTDALNAAALGYNVVWPSSEYYKLNPGIVKRFFTIAEHVLSCPDLDPTGQRQNHRLMMDDRDDVFLEIKTMQLPTELVYKKHGGNAGKDLRDFLRYYTRKNMQDIVKTALPYKFWDVEIPLNRDGKTKMKFKRELLEYKPNNLRMYNFLKNNGFYRYKVDEKANYIYIHIVGNVVTEVEANDIKNFINKFLETRKMDEDLRNAFYRTNQMGEMSFSALDIIDIDFTDYDQKEQFFFFENNVWKVTPAGIEAFKPGDVDKMVWSDEVIKHKVKKLPEPFTITHNAVNGDYDIAINTTECLFLNYLINTSRIYWRKELEEGLAGKTAAEQDAYREKYKFAIDGPNLDEDEIREQKLHLINKIYSLGYLLHRYKDPTQSWTVFAMDNKISDDGLSHGGSGKSIAYKAVRNFLKSVTFDGRNHKLFDNNHVFERVNKHVDYMLFDDANRNFQFDRMLSFTTGEMTVNPKGKTQIELAHKDVPKSVVTSNFTPNEISPTTLRRLLFTVFGDYYHHENGGEYNETRDPKSDTGKRLFDDFTENEWNVFCNVMAQCTRWFMNFEKIEPPMENVTARNLMNAMGTAFRSWADVYFSEEAGRRDAFIVKRLALEDFLRETRLTWSTQAFTGRLNTWCRFKGLALDPKELQNKDGRIIKNCPDYEFDNRTKNWYQTGKKKTFEMVYIQTPGETLTDRIVDPTDNPDTSTKEEFKPAVTPGNEISF